tara:strand:+ start:1115 stop:1402 length:288 start_codon:yes stop_codon:yes gene_type:complete
MKLDELNSEIVSFIKTKLEEEGIKDIEVTSESSLIGEGGVIDSMGIVELCLFLEDKALEMNFEFDWTSDSAMSNSRSIFASISTLAENFLEQSEK